MIEALVALLILLVGLLGLAGLQLRANQAQTESYQRVQALMLLRDMGDRINANRTAAASYVTGTSTPLGTAYTGCSAPVTPAEIDLCQWNASLLGATETSGGACTIATSINCVGGLIGARGCITATATANQYLVEVVWQGLDQTANPPTSVACGRGSYGDETVAATAGRRRAVTTVINIATLTP